jgi:hypothetical protein
MPEISPHLRLHNDALSHQAKANVTPIPKPERKQKAQGLQRSQLKRRKPLRHVVVVKASVAHTRWAADDAPAIWHRGIEGTTCVACHERPAVDAHHIIRLQILRKEAQAKGFDFECVRWDTRNRLGLCRHCHSGHHSGKVRLSHDLLWRYARRVYTFAEELELERVLDRDYNAPVFAQVSVGDGT